MTAKVPGVSPGYWTPERGWTFTGCKAHDKDPCAECDSGINDFLTVGEVASEWRVSKMTVYRMVHRGDLPSTRIGNSFRIRRGDANDYIKAQMGGETR